MDGMDNQAIIKWAVIAAVTYGLYKVFIKNKEGYEGGKLYYEDLANAYPASATTLAANESPQPNSWLPPMSVSTDLLPKPVLGDEDWTRYAPKGVLSGQNYLSPMAMIGTNTSGSRRGMSNDLRGAPPCPRGPPLPAPIDDGICVDQYRRGICDV